MIKFKKSQGMSFNVIVAAAIALVILVVVLSIFGSKSERFSKNINSCEQNGGRCVSEDECERPYEGLKCAEDTRVCCFARGGLT